MLLLIRPTLACFISLKIKQTKINDFSTLFTVDKYDMRLHNMAKTAKPVLAEGKVHTSETTTS